MKHKEMFGEAVWLTKSSDNAAFIVRGKFNIDVV